jgi:transcriptional regulator with XRE-family HTH domain
MTNIEKRSDFAKNLISIRKEKGFSQRDLAKTTGISNRMIAYYETHSDIPPLDKLQKIADALDISIAQLIDTELSDKNTLSLDTRTLKKVKLMEQLPPVDQRKVLTYIKDLIAKNNPTQDNNYQEE